MKHSVLCTTLLVEKSPQALPLGAACIASAIKHDSRTKDLCEVKLEAFSREDEDFSRLKDNDEESAKLFAEKLLQAEFKPEIVLFSVFVWNRIILEKTSLILREKGIITIAGGPEITAHPEVFTAFDYVTTGEGEEKVPELISIILNGSKKDTIQIPSTGTCKLDSLESPYLDGTIDPAEYGGALWELARGCPFKCSYCYESKGEKTVRLFPMERIQKELELFAQKKIPQVFVLDPTYNANKNRALELLNMMAKKTPDTFYYFEARAEFIDQQMAKAFTKIPCAVQIGLQSADEEVLKLVHRPFNKKQFVKNIGLLNNAGVIFGFDLIFGLPGENLKGFKEGIDFAISLYPNNLELFCLSVLPGTDLFDRAEELHLTYEQNPPYHIIHTDRYSEADIAQAGKLANACTLFYNDGRAVPWFNTICRALKIKPSQFFFQFGEFIEKKACDGGKQGKSSLMAECQSHKEIEQLQIEFIKLLCTQKNQQKLLKAAVDLIIFNGALSRTQDSGKSETIQLNYDAEYLASEYATDLQFFVQHVKPKPCRMQTFMNGRFADFRLLKK